MSSAITDPASVSDPSSVQRPPRTTSTSSPPIVVRPSPTPASGSASLTSSSRSAGLVRVTIGHSGRVHVVAVGDQLDVRVVVGQGRHREPGRPVVDAASWR